MEPPAARPRHRRGVSAAVPLFPVARRRKRGTAAAALADFRLRGATGRGLLVDGGLGSLKAGRGVAISPRDASGAGAADLCGCRLDLATAWGTIADSGVDANEDHGRDAGRPHVR